MKKLLIKNKFLILILAFVVAVLSAVLVIKPSSKKDGLNSFATGGVYTAFADEGQSESEETLKDLKAKVSTDGKYLLLISAFDDSILKTDGLYYIGYKYTVNGVQIDTTQLPDAKTATYYAGVSLKTANGVEEYGAKDIYSNAAYENYSLIVHEIEFETTYQEEGALIENLHSFITEMEQIGENEYKEVATTTSKNYLDNSKYRVANGNFDNDIEGWTFNNLSGEQPFGGVHANETFWGEGYAMNNAGNYFSAYADGASEASTGTLASPLFTVGGTGYITYMLGGAGNPRCYLTVENAAGEVLALYRNTRFADFPAGDYSLEDRRAMIGNTVFLANFVTYKADLSAYKGQQVKLVVHDLATAGWGVVFFDELNTFYAYESQIPENAFVAENLLANKTALAEELALEITAQGDYTADSFANYVEKLNAAKEIAGIEYATQTEVDNATNALTEARLALTVRPIEEVDGAVKSFRLASSDNKSLTIADYVNVNNLSNITYKVTSNNEKLTVGEIVDGVFTITAGEVDEETSVIVTVEVLYNGDVKLTVEVTVQITNEVAPTVFSEEVNKSCDVYALTDKESLVIDFAENVDNAGGLDLAYMLTHNGEEIVLESSSYIFLLGSYGVNETVETFTVTVSFVANEQNASISYVYNLAIKDTTDSRLVNGGFENGMDGWVKVGNIGNVSADTHYWVSEWENNGKGYEFGLDGEKMFSAYAGGEETAVGTLTSSTFTVGGSGFVTFKLGAMKDGNYVYVDVVDAHSKVILARYYNGLWAEYTNDLKSGCSLIAYKADLSSLIGREVFFRISDNADSGYGLFFVDSFNTYYEKEPSYFNNATPVNYAVSGTIYDVFNGGFEMGDVQGWWNNGEPGAVTNANAFFSGVAYGKEGAFLYSGVEDFQAGNGREGNQGVLTSSTFEIGGSGWISFKLGGGNSFCYVQVIDADTNQVLARYRQQARQDAVLIQYVADLSAHIGTLARIQLVDYASSDWGCVSFDNVVTYYAQTENLPEGLTANDTKYAVVNGSFENGLDGWKMSITEAGAHNTLGWVESSEHDAGWYTKNDDNKDGNNLFTFVKPDGTNCENSKGTLQTANFVLQQNTYVSFRFGGAGGGQNHDVHIQLCRADGSVIATFFNDKEGKQNTRMNGYFYYYEGAETDCFFRVVDNSTGDYGCFVVDDFRANQTVAPEGFVQAIL